MSDSVKISLIVSAAAVICSGILVYYGAYHSCMREFGYDSYSAAICVGR